MESLTLRGSQCEGKRPVLDPPVHGGGGERKRTGGETLPHPAGLWPTALPASGEGSGRLHRLALHHRGSSRIDMRHQFPIKLQTRGEIGQEGLLLLHIRIDRETRRRVDLRRHFRA
jgi:hypothetical protein